VIHVAYASSSPSGGGALNYLVDLVEQHDRSLVQSRVYVDTQLRDAERALARLEAAGAEVRRGPLASPFDGLRHPGWWRRELRRAGPVDIAHLHQHVPGAGWMFLVGARAAGVPHLVRTEHLPRFPPNDRLRLWPPRLAYHLGRRRLASITDHRIVVSQASRMALARRGEPLDGISVVPISFEESRFEHLPERVAARRQLGWPEDVVVVGFLASLTDQKRPDLFLDAADRLAGRHPRSFFVIGGAGPLEPMVRRRVRRLGDRVRFIGARTDVPVVLAAMDIFVLPSMFEGLPITVVEALRSGAAVVATAVDGTPEVVEDHVTGRLCEAGDLKSLVDALDALIADPTEVRRLGDNGARRVAGRFTAKLLAVRTEDIYRRLMDPPPGQHPGGTLDPRVPT
jgi:glycosyltransferase involved in cell wall biosynthesis